MRKHILVLALGLLTSISFGQTFSAGDLVVVAIDNEGFYSSDPGVNDTYGNGVYLIALKDIPVGAKFRVTDNYYDSSSNTFLSDGITNKDGTVEWENNTSGVISAGSRIDIYNVQANFHLNIVASPGKLSRIFEPGDNMSSSVPNGKMKLENGGDAIYVYTVDANENPDVFITAFTNEGFNADNGDLPAGLSIGSTAFDLSNNAHCAVYDGATSGFADYDQVRASVYDSSNWTSESGPGNNSQDQFTPNIPSNVIGGIQDPALPIDLINFDVYKHSDSEVLILWSSARELDNDYYEVERAGADLRFNTLETVDGAILSDEVLNYEVIDEQPLDGVNYYRLKQVDLDGTSSYFDVRSVDFGSDQKGVVFPNPVNGKISIKGDSYLGATYSIIDLSGAVKMTGVVTRNEVELSAEGLKEGIYFLQLTANGSTHTYKFSKI